MLSVTAGGCNDTVPRRMRRVGKKETRWGVCAGVLTLARTNVTKLHNITHNEALAGSQPVGRKTFYVLVTLSKMLFAAAISRNNNFADTHSRSLEGLGPEPGVRALTVRFLSLGRPVGERALPLLLLPWSAVQTEKTLHGVLSRSS